MSQAIAALAQGSIQSIMVIVDSALRGASITCPDASATARSRIAAGQRPDEVRPQRACPYRIDGSQAQTPAPA
jgi:hypothetical protein